jgi:hypothetical protein
VIGKLKEISSPGYIGSGSEDEGVVRHGETGSARRGTASSAYRSVPTGSGFRQLGSSAGSKWGADMRAERS